MVAREIDIDVVVIGFKEEIDGYGIDILFIIFFE